MTAPGPSQSTDPRVASYLDALNRALYGLPDSVRAEVYGEIRQHIDDELAVRPDDESAVPEVLERLGDPTEIAREAGAYPQQPSLPPSRSKAQEIAAVILVAVGGFVFGVGWIVGVVLLWTSQRFTRADKIIGTLLVPGGFFTSLILFGFGVVGTTTVETCRSVTQSPVVSPSGPQSLPLGVLTQARTVCTGGHSWVFTAIVIVVFVLVILGPLYTVIRLSRRVASM